MSVYTPGPYLIGAIRTLVLSRAGSVLAQTDVEPHIPEDAARANARLFAAAPDLLDAAKEALSGMDGGEDHSMCHTGICSRGECTQCQRVDRLRAAVRKAEGR